MSQFLLRDLAPGQAYAISFRSVDGAGNTSDWSQVQRFTTTADTMPPGDVTNLSFYTAGKSFVAQWDTVIHNADGTTLRDFRYYHLHFTSINASGAADFYSVQPYFELTEAQNIAAFGTFQSNMSVAVTAVDMMYNESVHPATATKDATAPPVPSAPIVGNYLGLLMVTWDGNASTGTAMPTNLLYAEVHVSTASNFTPSNSTFAARLYADGSGNKTTISGLTYGTTYYVRLIAVNSLLKRSGPSVQGSGIPLRITGLDIQNGQISAEQINWQATGIPGGNAFYQTSQPTSGMVNGDIWYDTDNAYTTYRYNGTTWVLAPDVGFIPASKLIAGTITANAIGANQIITASANIADAVIDDAKISDLSAAKITTGSIAASQSVAAGPLNDTHAEMNSTGFYVMSPTSATAGQPTPVMIPTVKMGTGDGDTFSVTDPNTPDQTLASISSGGVGSFQDLYVAQSPTIAGQDLLGTPVVGDPVYFPQDPGTGGAFTDRPFGHILSANTNMSGIEPSGSAGIRSEYGIAQYRTSVVAGRSYLVSFQMPSFYISASAQFGGEVHIKVREQQDLRSVADQEAAPFVGSATQATINSNQIFFQFMNNIISGDWQDPYISFIWTPNYTGYSNLLVTLELSWPSGTDAVIKVPGGSIRYTTMNVVDVGVTPGTLSGMESDGGGTLYNYTATPAPPPTTTNYYWQGNANWVRSYQGNGIYMSNTNGDAYQGQDPSGYNGNQHALYGWSSTNFNTMLSGATNITMKLYLYFSQWYYNSGGTAVIGTSTAWGDPGGSNSPGYTSNRMQSASWPKPGGRDVTLISNMVNDFKSGAARSIVLGPGPSTSETYYGYATQATMKVWYTK